MSTFQSSVSRTSSIGWIRQFGGWFVIILGVLIGLIGAIVTFFGTAYLVSSPVLLLLMALLICFASSGGLTWIGLTITQRARPQRRTIALSTGAIVTLIVGVLIAATVLRRLPGSSGTPRPRSTTRYWSLPTGSRIAYSMYPAVGPHKPTPIVFLHGGPGLFALDADHAFYSQFSEDGFDVYLYDQAGSGLSDLLPQARDYTVSRSVADLEAIRQQIGAEKLILIGHSWGSELAASYMAAYPQHVARTIFHSPGPLWNSNRLKPDYGRTASEAESGLPPIRAIAAILLFNINPDAAEALVGQDEFNAWFDNELSSSLGELFCKEDAAKIPRDVRAVGTNFYANISINNTTDDLAGDPRPRLTTNQTPTLILHAACEYLPWWVALEYKQTFPQATLVHIDKAGHMINLSQPELAYKIMRAFLLGQELPVQPYTGQQEP